MLKVPVVAMVVVVLWSCASGSRALTDLPDNVSADALRDSILAKPAVFVPFEGAEDVVKVSITGKKTKGWVYPEQDANQGSPTHMKILGIIKVSRKYRDIEPNTWTRWAIIQLKDGTLASAFASAGNPLVIRPLSQVTGNHAHPHAKAAWQHHSAASPWATCGGAMCCCEGSECEASEFALP